MNNVDRMIAGLRCCAENKNVCVADECPLFEMCQAYRVNPMAMAAEMLAALVQQRNEAQNELAQVRRERDAAIDDITNAAPCFACKHFKRNGGTCGGGKLCLENAVQAEWAGEEYKGPAWEWRGVQEVAEDA